MYLFMKGRVKEMDDQILECIGLIFEELVVIQHGFEETNPKLAEQLDKITGDLENLMYNMKGVEQ